MNSATKEIQLREKNVYSWWRGHRRNTKNLWSVSVGQIRTRRRRVDRDPVENPPAKVASLLKFGNALLESLYMSGPSSTRCTLGVLCSVGRKVIVSFHFVLRPRLEDMVKDNRTTAKWRHFSKYGNHLFHRPPSVFLVSRHLVY